MSVAGSRRYSGLKEVAELDKAEEPGPLAVSAPSSYPAFKGGSIEVRKIDMAYGSVQVLHDVSLKVAAGTVTCLIGPSGSGKSTLLRCLNRLAERRAGDILLDGASIDTMSPDQLRRRIGMVFQQFNLFPHKHRAGQHLARAAQAEKLPPKQASGPRHRAARPVGARAQGPPVRPIFPGGQQQRVAIARALAHEPEVMLFDEVTCALDPELVKGVLGADGRSWPRAA